MALAKTRKWKETLNELQQQVCLSQHPHRFIHISHPPPHSSNATICSASACSVCHCSAAVSIFGFPISHNTMCSAMSSAVQCGLLGPVVYWLCPLSFAMLYWHRKPPVLCRQSTCRRDEILADTLRYIQSTNTADFVCMVHVWFLHIWYMVFTANIKQKFLIHRYVQKATSASYM